MNQIWNQSGNQFFIGETTSQKKELPVGVYNIHCDPRSGELSLSLIAEEFTFPYKVYGLEHKFVQRMRKTYDNTSQNLGILLNGEKGSGKSVVAKQICNSMEMPILIVDAPYPGLVRFLNIIQQDVVVFLDEYEKVFANDKGKGDEMLTIMDGVHSNNYRRVFLLTTNYLFISSNLLQRPGRIRYAKTFGDLTPELVEEIVDDILIWPEYKNDIIVAVSKMSIITIDLVKALVNEVNIHEESPKDFIEYFNVKKPDNEYGLYSAYVMKDGQTEKKPLFSNLRLSQGVMGVHTGHYLNDTSENYIARVQDKYGNGIFKIKWGEIAVSKEYFDEEGEFNAEKWTEEQSNTVILGQKDGKPYYYYLTHRQGEGVIPHEAIVKITEDASKHYMYNNLQAAL